ncbi:MAG: RAM signaling network component [Thelocarpon superellum]|nr:MAG: RAM signaling network component [Thelocarpon superellum]
MDRPPPTRPMRRAGSGRFPVKVSTGAGDFPPDPASPAGVQSSRPNPPASSRSHSRVPSQQQNHVIAAAAASRRPAATPLVIGLERSRSNSEGILQAARSKRMGIVSRKTSELGTVVEARPARLSHYRGLSHGSVMDDKSASNGTPSSADGSSGPVSPAENDHVRGTYVRRLSSLPEHKRESRSPNHVVEGAKGILYALHLVQPHISTLIIVVRDERSKRSSLERVFYNAATHVDELDRELHRFEKADDEDDSSATASVDGIRRACLTCVMAYQVVGSLLLRSVRRIVSRGDPRYVRSLLLLVYNSLVEVRNACVNVSMLSRSRRQPRRIASKHRPRERSLTPTQERVQPGQRLRSATVIKHSGSSTATATATATAAAAAAASTSKGRRAQIQPPAPLKINGNGHPKPPAMSNSQSSGTNGTPASAEAFAIPSLIYGDSSRHDHGVQSPEEAEEERQFEKIFLTLTRAYEIVLKALPSVKHQFVRCIEVCKKQETQKELKSLWHSLDQRCSFAMQMAETVRTRLSTIKLKEPGVRNEKEFWELCNTFVKAFVETALLVKDARKLELIPNDVLQILRPVQQAVKEVGVLIDASPWKYLAAPQPSSSAPPAITQAMIHTGLQQALSGLSVVGQTAPSSTAPALGPYVTPLPATPLSAALGPAAQATVPFIVPSQRLNVFDRADMLLSAPSRTLNGGVTDLHGQSPNILSPLGSRSHSRHPK